MKESPISSATASHDARKERPFAFATASKDIQEALLLYMDECGSRYHAGDKMALMHAIAHGAMFDMALPDWAADAYMRSYRDVMQWRVGSWDDVFGNPVPKGKRLAKLREHHIMWPKVTGAIKEILDADPCTPIDDQLFERVGDELGVGKTLVKKVWYGLNPALRGHAIRAKQEFKLPR